eukprot:2999786-Alexandrium_andersonii.AAC.1
MELQDAKRGRGLLAANGDDIETNGVRRANISLDPNGFAPADFLVLDVRQPVLSAAQLQARGVAASFKPAAASL